MSRMWKGSMAVLAAVLLYIVLPQALKAHAEISYTVAQLLENARAVQSDMPPVAFEAEAIDYLEIEGYDLPLPLGDLPPDQPLSRSLVHFRRNGELVDILENSYEYDPHSQDLVPAWESRRLWDGEFYLHRQQSSKSPQKRILAAASTDLGDQKSIAYSRVMGGFLEGGFRHNPTGWVSLLRAQDVVLKELTRDKIDRYLCDVVMAHTAHGDYKLWVDSAHGFNIRKAEVTLDQDDLAYGGKRLLESPLGFSKIRMEVKDIVIEEIEGHFFPVQGTLTNEMLFADGHIERSRTQVVRRNIQFNPDFEAMGAFKMDLPDGTPVTNMSTQQSYIWDQGRLVPRDELKVQRVIGRKAPELDVAEWVNGEPVKLSALRGRTVVLAFWNSRDEACAELVSVLNASLSKYSEEGTEIISIHTADADVLKQFISDNSIKFRVAVDKPAQNYKAATFEAYRVEKVPAVFIIDPEGRVRYQDISLEAVEEALKTLVGTE